MYILWWWKLCKVCKHFVHPFEQKKKETFYAIPVICSCSVFYQTNWYFKTDKIVSRIQIWFCFEIYPRKKMGSSQTAEFYGLYCYTGLFKLMFWRVKIFLLFYKIGKFWVRISFYMSYYMVSCSLVQVLKVLFRMVMFEKIPIFSIWRK